MGVGILGQERAESGTDWQSRLLLYFNHFPNPTNVTLGFPDLQPINSWHRFKNPHRDDWSFTLGKEKYIFFYFYCLHFHLFQSQQKCIVIFALVCCFAILVALIFSAVDIVGEDEDGLSEKNCQNNCR